MWILCMLLVFLVWSAEAECCGILSPLGVRGSLGVTCLKRSDL